MDFFSIGTGSSNTTVSGFNTLGQPQHLQSKSLLLVLQRNHLCASNTKSESVGNIIICTSSISRETFFFLLQNIIRKTHTDVIRFCPCARKGVVSMKINWLEIGYGVGNFFQVSIRHGHQLRSIYINTLIFNGKGSKTTLFS